MKFNWSYSAADIYEQSPLWWFYQYISKPTPSDKTIETYGIAGNVPHKFLENYLLQKEPNDFLSMWKNQGLNTMSGFNGQPLSLPAYIKAKDRGLQLIKNYRTLGYTLSPEKKFNFKYDDNINIKGFVDVIAEKNGQIILIDYKTSTKKTKNEFVKQQLFYSWLYWKGTGVIPTKCVWYYIKIDLNKKTELIPTLKLLQNFEREQYKIIEEIKTKGNNITEYGAGSYDSPWNKYKSLMEARVKAKNKTTLTIEYGRVSLDCPSEKLQQELAAEFSYEEAGAFFIKRAAGKRGYQADGIKRFFRIKDNSLPIGFLNRLKRRLLLKGHELNIVDKRAPLREYNMPHELLDRKLRPYQKEAVNFIMGNKITTTEIVTGVGKTTIAAEVIRQNKGLTLFVVDRNILLTQVVKSFEKMFGERIGTIKAGNMDLKKITIATIQTLNSLIKKDDKQLIKYLTNVKTFIIDEAHCSATTSYTIVGKYVYNASIRLGLTGTYERPDGKDMDIESVVGYNEYKIIPKTMIDEGHLMNPKVWFFRHNSGAKLESASAYHDYYTANIVNNKERNAMFLKILNQFKNKNILIITSEIAHGKYLQYLIPGSVFIEGAVDDKTRDGWLDEMRAGHRKIIIGTASIVQKGLDIPNLEVGFNMTGNSSPIITKQFLGRLLRKCEGKTECHYIDFMDNGEFFEKHSNERVITLKKEGYKVQIFNPK